MNIEKNLKFTMWFVAIWMIIYWSIYAIPSVANLLYYSNSLELNNLNLLNWLNIFAVSILTSIFWFLFIKDIKKYFVVLDFYILLHSFVCIIEILLVLTWKVSWIIILLQISYDIIIPSYLYLLKIKYKNLKNKKAD